MPHNVIQSRDFTVGCVQAILTVNNVTFYSRQLQNSTHTPPFLQTSEFQQTMFFLISLKSSGQKKIVPLKWVNNLNLADLLNYGVTAYKKKEHLVYISSDVNDEPDFTLEIFDAIENEQPALYRAFVIKCFGKYFKRRIKEI